MEDLGREWYTMLMKFKTYMLIVALAGVFLSLTMCSDGTRGKTEPASQNPGSQGDTDIAKSDLGALTVKIVPESPTVLTGIQAVLNAKADAKISYRWERNGIELVDEKGSTLAAKDHFAKGDRVTVTVTANGRSASASTVIKNSPPTVKSVTLRPEIIYRGVDITADPVSFDADGDYVRYNFQWFVNDTDVSETTSVLKGNTFKRGDRVAVKVTPYDSDDEGPHFMTPPVVIPNGPPRIVSSPPSEFKAENYTYQVIAEDPDGDPLTYSLTSAPQGMTIDAKTGLITLPIKKEDAGTHDIEVIAQDPQGLKAVQKYSLTINVP